MSSPSHSPRAVRYLLGSLLAFMALNAVGGGVYGLLGAEGMPTELLEGSPFKSYFIPSLILLVVVGGSLLASAIAVFSGARPGRLLALATGLILLIWIGVQVAIIGYVSWMQPAVAVAGVLILVLAWLLPRPALATNPPCSSPSPPSSSAPHPS